MATDLKLISDLHFAVLPRPQQCPRLLQIRFIERLGSAAHATPTTGGLQTCVHPLTQYVTLKLRKRGEDVKCKLTARPTGRAMWQMMGVLAELERSLISERTCAGVKDAKRRGVKFGRKPKLTALQIELARKQIKRGEDRRKVAESFKVNRTTLYRALATFLYVALPHAAIVR